MLLLRKYEKNLPGVSGRLQDLTNTYLFAYLLNYL